MCFGAAALSLAAYGLSMLRRVPPPEPQAATVTPPAPARPAPTVVVVPAAPVRPPGTLPKMVMAAPTAKPGDLPPSQLSELEKELKVTEAEHARLDASLSAFRLSARQLIHDRRRGQISDENFRAALKTTDEQASREMIDTLGPERGRRYVESLGDKGVTVPDAESRR
jgi:hypothetical protein